MLIAACSSRDFACCARATASARSKQVSALVASRSGDIRAISPAMRWTSASYHLSVVVSTAVIASPIWLQASSHWPSSPQAIAKWDKYHGNQTVDPIERYIEPAEVKMLTASEALPVKAKRLARFNNPRVFQ